MWIKIKKKTVFNHLQNTCFWIRYKRLCPRENDNSLWGIQEWNWCSILYPRVVYCDFIFILFSKMKVFISEFFDFFADFFLVTPCHCNHFVQFLSNGLWLFSGSLLMVCTIWNFSTTQWGYCSWFAQCFTVSAEGLTFDWLSRFCESLVYHLWWSEKIHLVLYSWILVSDWGVGQICPRKS